MSLSIRHIFPILRDSFIVGCVTIAVLAFAYQVRTRILVDVGSPRDDFFLYGFLDPESKPDLTYRWTQGKARVELEGQQLGAPWTLRMRLNGYRPNRPALVQIQINDTYTQSLQTTGDWNDYEIKGESASDAWSGTTTFTFASDTFIPQNFDANNPDSRRLGIAIDRMEWTPARSVTAIGTDDAWIDLETIPALPPIGIVLTWGATIGMLYAAVRTTGLAARLVNLGFAAGLVLLACGFGFLRPYLATYTTGFLNLAVALAVLAVILRVLVPRIASLCSISLAARDRAILPAIILLCVGLKLGGAWYPHFRSSDLLFHAHRLELVSQGNLFFTSELPDAARRVVPYPPSLYIVLSPLASWIPDAQGILLISNVLFETLAILAVYFTARKLFTGTDTASHQRSAILATFLFAFNPVSFWIYSWGNHTNIFGQTSATLLLCVLLTLPLTQNSTSSQSIAAFRPSLYFFFALFLLVAAATAHLGVFLSLLTFFPLAVGARLLARGGNVKRDAMGLALLFLAGLVFAVLLYYAEFAGLLMTQATKFVADFAGGEAAAGSGVTIQRAGDVARQTADQFGWVLLLAGVAGIPLAWKSFSAGARAAWGAWLLVSVFFGFLTLGASFSTRYTLWAAPALALSGGLFLAWLADKPRAARFGVYALCAFALAQTLWLWIDRVINAYQ